jgi:hypothetical protein
MYLDRHPDIADRIIRLKIDELVKLKSDALILEALHVRRIGPIR